MKILIFCGGKKKQQDISPWLEIFGSTQYGIEEYMGINSGEQNYN